MASAGGAPNELEISVIEQITTLRGESPPARSETARYKTREDMRCDIVVHTAKCFDHSNVTLIIMQSCINRNFEACPCWCSHCLEVYNQLG